MNLEYSVITPAHETDGNLENQNRACNQTGNY